MCFQPPPPVHRRPLLTTPTPLCGRPLWLALNNLMTHLCSLLVVCVIYYCNCGGAVHDYILSNEVYIILIHLKNIRELWMANDIRI